MPAYWLVPMTRSEPVTLGSERVALSAAEGEALRRMFAAAHPRLLPSFKLALLVGGDEDACGPENGEALPPLSSPGDIVLDGGLSLSHCGHAFVERLAAPAEALRAIEAVFPEEGAADELAARVRDWWRQGYRAMLLKEE